METDPMKTRHHSMFRASPLTMALLAGAACVGVAGGPAHAQTAWAGAVNGSWFDAGKWTAGVPNGGTLTTLGLAGPYTVSLQNANGICGPLTISNASAILNIFDNSQLDVNGNISNAGLIQVSGPGAPGNATRLSAATNLTHSGGGTIRLSALGNGDNDTAYIINQVGGGLTNAAGSFVRGAGRIYAPFNNNGTVNADQNGKGLILLQSAKTNTGLITASSGGYVQLRTSMTQTAAGVMQSSNDSPIQINNSNAVITGGTLNGAGTNSGIQYFGVARLDAVTLQNSNMVMDNTQVNIGAGGVVNNGTWTISSPTAPGNNTRISADAANVIVSGTGTIRLQGVQGGNGDNDTAYLTNSIAGNVLTNASTHSIRGYGRVYTNLVNNGTVNADVAGKYIVMMDQPKANNGTMTASNGGVLLFRNITVTGNPTAQIISTDSSSPVQFQGATMTGGGFNTSGTGVFQYFSGNTLSNLTVNGSHQITDNSFATIATDLVNNGNWTISAPTAAGNFTRMQAGGNVAINGTGTIRLQGVQGGNGDNDTASIYYTNAANVLTLGANQQVRGYGRVHANIVNNGTVNADNTPNNAGPANKGIVLMEQPKTNNATITSSNGGWWYIRGINFTNNGTLTSANNSGTQVGGGFENCTVTGGTISNLANLFFSVNGAVNLNAATITTGSGLQINDNAALNTTGLTNNGTMLVSAPTAAGNNTRIQAAAANTTIGGTGTIRLQGVQSGNGDNDTAYLYYTNAANLLTLGANQQLRGYGRVYTNLVNNGTINADNTPNNAGPANKGIVLMEQPKVNNATITSSNGGWWYVRGTTLTNNGTLTSANNSGTQSGGGFENCTVTGGTISNLANLFFGTNGTTTINGSTVTAGSGLQVNDNAVLVTSGLTNNGTIAVQKVGNPGNNTRLRAGANNATIAGTGTVRLNSVNNIPNDTAYLEVSDSVNFTGVFGAGQTLAGIGRVYHKWILNGTISPGQTATGSGEIQCQSGAVTFSPTTKFIVHANGSGVSGNYDRLTGSSTKDVNGQLVMTFEGGYSPSIGDKYDIITGPNGGVNGEFASLQLPNPFGRARVIYLPDRVRVTLCYADCDGNSTLGIDDFICFQTQFALGDAQADCDESGTLSIDDFICFQTYYAIGC